MTQDKSVQNDIKLENLRADHANQMANAERFRSSLKHEIDHMLGEFTLGVPIESRVKTWTSVEERLQRKPVPLTGILDLDDFIGLRIILLFRRDLDLALEKIKEKFDIVSSENKADALEHTQFGYQSYHYVVRLPKTWLEVPSFAGLEGFKAELQIRTLAQHIWAAASHKLQYKQEGSVPPILMRSIYRASALLETVDLEFERILAERTEYSESIKSTTAASDELNVDLLASILTETLPAKNQNLGNEDYDEVLSELRHFGINTGGEVRALITKRKTEILKEEAERQDTSSDPERRRRRVFFTHGGLLRTAMKIEYGKKWQDMMQEKQKLKTASRSRRSKA